MDNKDLNKQDNVSIKSPYVNGARDDAHSADDQKRSSDSESDNSTVEYFSSGKNNKPSSNKPADADSSSGSDDSIVSDDTSDLDDSVVAEENAAAMIKKLREKLKKAESEKQEYLTGWQRDKAEFINARKRDQEDKQSFIKFANENLVSELIPVMESFDMAMGNKEAWEKVDKNWRIGVEYIYSQLKKALADNGVIEINPIDQKFDHALHEAVSFEPVADKKKDQIVLQVIQRGLSLNGKVLKAPKVKVGEYK